MPSSSFLKFVPLYNSKVVGYSEQKRLSIFCSYPFFIICLFYTYIPQNWGIKKQESILPFTWKYTWNNFLRAWFLNVLLASRIDGLPYRKWLWWLETWPTSTPLNACTLQHQTEMVSKNGNFDDDGSIAIAYSSSCLRGYGTICHRCCCCCCSLVFVVCSVQITFCTNIRRN